MNFVNETVFHKWWTEFGLPHLMWALRETTNASVLELQGRWGIEPSLSRLLVYGTKGKEEEELARKFRTKNLNKGQWVGS